MAKSQNGYRVLEEHETKLWTIPMKGRNRHFRLAPGAPGFVLAHLILWFHDEVEKINKEEWDEWGWAPRDIRGSTTTSNHASGTAADVNATEHPLGIRGTFSRAQEKLIRRRLKYVYLNCVRWGGDYNTRADEMHFEINAPRRKVRALARVLRYTPRGRKIRKAN